MLALLEMPVSPEARKEGPSNTESMSHSLDNLSGSIYRHLVGFLGIFGKGGSSVVGG